MQVFRFRADHVHTVMDWVPLWAEDLDIVGLRVSWPGLDRSIINEVLKEVSEVPLCYAAMFIIGFTLSQVTRYQVRLLLRNGMEIVIRRVDDVIEVLAPDGVKVKYPKFPLQLLNTHHSPGTTSTHLHCKKRRKASQA